MSISPIKYLEVYETLGVDVVRRLYEHFKDISVYIRKDKSHEQFKCIVKAIGKKNADTLVDTIGGSIIIFPSYVFKSRTERLRAERAEIRRHFKAGFNTDELSWKYNKSKILIEKILRLRFWDPEDFKCCRYDPRKSFLVAENIKKFGDPS